jgi:hypothetical protein
MKKKTLDLNRKLVLNKETIANLTPSQPARFAAEADNAEGKSRTSILILICLFTF